MLDTPTSQGIIVNLLKSQVLLALFIFSEGVLAKCEYLVSL